MDADKNKMSIKFRDNFINDLENSHVWFNLEEFADIHNIDGAEIMAITVALFLLKANAKRYRYF